jgi:hypothetical protein
LNQSDGGSGTNFCGNAKGLVRWPAKQADNTAFHTAGIAGIFETGWRNKLAFWNAMHQFTTGDDNGTVVTTFELHMDCVRAHQNVNGARLVEDCAFKDPLGAQRLRFTWPPMRVEIRSILKSLGVKSTMRKQPMVSLTK